MGHPRASPGRVPVPLHPSRLAERGYNQAALLGSRLAGHLGAQSLPLALERICDTPRQTTLDRAARTRNVADAFRARPRSRVSGRQVLLIDDVRTTGATLAACARALREAGATRVSAAVVARTE